MVKVDKYTARPRYATARLATSRRRANRIRRRAAVARGGRSSARHKRGVATALARRFAAIRVDSFARSHALDSIRAEDSIRRRRRAFERVVRPTNIGFVTTRDAGDARRARDAGRARGTTTSDARDDDDDDDDGDGDGETRDDDEARRARERRDDARAMDDDASRTVRRDASAGDGERDG